MTAKPKPTAVDDASLSDHEWRLKMAAEGKAVYVPGKSQDDPKTVGRPAASARTVQLTQDEWHVLDTAIPDIIEVLADVRNVFHDLAYQGDLDQAWVNSVMRLAARAVTSMEEKEVHVLDRLDVALRHSTREGASQ